MHDHWSLSKSYPFEKNAFFLENTEKEKGGDHGVHQGDI